jgi:hypothetical protein
MSFATPFSLFFSPLGLSMCQAEKRTLLRSRTEEGESRLLQALPFLIGGKGNCPQLFYGFNVNIRLSRSSSFHRGAEARRQLW